MHFSTHFNALYFRSERAEQLATSYIHLQHHDFACFQRRMKTLDIRLHKCCIIQTLLGCTTDAVGVATL